MSARLIAGAIVVFGLVAGGASCPQSITCPQHNTLASFVRDDFSGNGKWRVYKCNKFKAEHELRVKCDN